MKNKFLLIGDLTGRRMSCFIDCLNMLEINEYKVIDWMDVLKDTSILEKYIESNTIIKLEPPEKNMEIYRGFLKRGVSEGVICDKEINKLDFSDFPIIAPKQWYRGFSSVIEDIEKLKNSYFNKDVYFMNDLKETLIMMDKEQSYKLLKEQNNNYDFSLPERLESPRDYDTFKEIYGDRYMKCFIKLRYGSGSTGVLAYSYNPRTLQEKVYTSMNVEELKGKKRFFSNYRVHCVEDKKKIKDMIDWVLFNGAHIEKWIPKSTHEGRFFDTRSFVINKESRYLISRLSKGPITNLHLKNKRLESKDFISDDNIERIKKASEDVMKIFNRSLYAGIDVVTTQSYKPYIIDVNPFGDLLHNLLGTKENVHYLEIEKAIEQLQGGMNR
ncbi:STM4014 family protein [Oceanirhabdus sp. W0125-5]|uniref:STM4014 family protein n=1 Tax=Oceanirhabdus sp. W0125-5 TaxID=2999116 RepID=UPI0022F2B205|nr:STM4014 family protein [Oceanirhabdus sp. W0125-5]WBW98353.1 STM4014 family protein [Oceanirhabdus sp. W0125-5]